jgi:hypothetical protein
MLDRLLLNIEISCDEEDGRMFVCNQIEYLLLQRYKKISLPVLAVDVDFEGV